MTHRTKMALAVIVLFPVACAIPWLFLPAAGLLVLLGGDLAAECHARATMRRTPAYKYALELETARMHHAAVRKARKR